MVLGLGGRRSLYIFLSPHGACHASLLVGGVLAYASKCGECDLDVHVVGAILILLLLDRSMPCCCFW